MYGIGLGVQIPAGRVYYRKVAQVGRAPGLGHKIVVPKIITYYIISGNGLVWFRALGLGPRDFGGSNPPYPTIYRGEIMLCKYCNKEFSLQQKGSGGSNRIFCYECMPSNSNRVERNKQRAALLLEYSNKIKLERGCDKCGYNKCATALEWHHPNEDKDGDPSILLRHSLDKYLEEVSKCDLLCANCHREEHSK